MTLRIALQFEGEVDSLAHAAQLLQSAAPPGMRVSHFNLYNDVGPLPGFGAPQPVSAAYVFDPAAVAAAEFEREMQEADKVQGTAPKAKRRAKKDEPVVDDKTLPLPLEEPAAEIAPEDNPETGTDDAITVEITDDELREACMALVRADKRPVLAAALETFGVKQATKLPSADRPRFLAHLKEHS